MRSRQDNRDDATLVAVCNSGASEDAERAFTELYRRHRDYILRIALRFTDNREVAADALQEVFTYLLKQFPPPGPGLTLTARLTTFLYPVAKNTTLNLLRRQRREGSGDVDPDQLTASEEAADSADDLDRLLADLPAERREILCLRFLDGLKIEEISELLDIPIGTVKSRLHNAIRALREHPAAKNFFET